jgi:hypothetical protein
MCAVLAFAVLVCAGAPTAMSAEVGGGNALSELTQGGGETTATQTTATTSTSTESSSNSSKVVIIALLAAGALLIGIAFVIVRDARRVAPVPDGQLAEGGPASDAGAKLRRRRAQAKAARRQRKRNR